VCYFLIAKNMQPEPSYLPRMAIRPGSKISIAELPLPATRRYPDLPGQ